LLFYAFLSHGNEEEKKRKKKRGVGCNKGECCVLSTSTCDSKYNIMKKWGNIEKAN
jgi:hypothetical protein